MSSGGKGKGLKELVKNVKEIISWNKERDNEKENTVDFSRPVFVTLAALSKELEFFRACALQATDKENKKFKDMTQETSRKRAGENKIACKKEKRIKQNETNSVILTLNDLIGKVVHHFCYLDDDSEEERWHRGILLEKVKSTKYLMRYHQLRDKTVPCDIKHDFKSDKLKLVDLAPKDLVGASVRHLLKDDETGEDIWWDAEVVDIDLESKKENPVIFIMYHTHETEYDLDELGNVENEFYEIRLMDDYSNGWLHIRSVGLTSDGVDFEFKHCKYLLLNNCSKNKKETKKTLFYAKTLTWWKGLTVVY